MRQVNHTSHFLLSKLLMPSLEAAAEARGEARIVQHSSGARHMFFRPLAAEYFGRSAPGALGGDGIVQKMMRYHMTKLANSVFAMELHARLRRRGSKVKSLVAEPGGASTNLAFTTADAHGSRLATALLNWGMYLFAQTAADGACPLISCCYGADARSGDFLVPRWLLFGTPVPTIAQGKPLRSRLTSDEGLTCSEANAALLWSASEAAIGEPFEL